MAKVQKRRCQGLMGAALAVSLLTACGSTVQYTTKGAALPDGLRVASPVEGGPTSGPADVPTGDGAALPGGQQPVPGAAVDGSGSTGASGTPTATRPGQPTTARPGSGSPKAIRLGVITQPGLETTAKAFGLDGVTTGDTRKQVDAVLAWLKVNGGLAGRSIQVFEYKVDSSDSNNAQIQTNACTAMTQDYKVDYVLTVLGSLQTLAACLQKAGIPLLADNTNFGDSTMRKYASILANPSEVAPGRSNTLMIEQLWKQGWLTSSSKVGILALDGPDSKEAVEGPITAALQRHGLKAAVTVYVNPNGGDGGSSASSSAVLRFRQAGVDRVLPVLYSPIYMMTTAESQGYRPAYALLSQQGPGALLETLAPKEQLKNAAGIGWQPYLDIGSGKRPGPVSTRETLCFDLMKKANQAATSALVKGFQAQVCDLLFYLKDLSIKRPDLPRDLMTSGRKLLGSSYVSPSTFHVDVTNRTDGMAGYRPLAFLDGCQCFEYTGPLVKTS